MDHGNKERRIRSNDIDIAVLLIEQEPSDVDYLRTVFADQREETVRITCAKDFEEAQSLSLQAKFDLVLLDPFFEGFIGFDALDRAKKIFPNVPIVILTDLDDPQIAVRAFQEGAQNFLPKRGMDGHTLGKTLRYAVERFRLKAQLVSSRQSYMNVLSDNSDGILVIDDEHIVTYANPAAASLFQRDLDALLGTPFGLPFTSVGSTEVDIVRDDGKPVVVEMRVSKTDWHGQEATLVILHDITERKLAELALRKSEERFRLFIEHAPSALAMFDREMRYLAVSRRWITDYGLDDQDIVGRSHYEVFPDLPDRWKAVHRRALGGESVTVDEDWFQRSDGSGLWIRWEVRPWHAVDGGIEGVVIFSENITKRKNAEEALSASEERFRQVAENAGDWIWEVDANGLYTFCSPAVEKILGYSPKEIDYSFAIFPG